MIEIVWGGDNEILPGEFAGKIKNEEINQGKFEGLDQQNLAIESVLGGKERRESKL